MTQPATVSHDGREYRSNGYDHRGQHDLADREQVVARFTVRGTQTGVFQGIPATGSAAAVSGIAIERVAGGRVAELWLEYDQLGLLQQLGAIRAIG